MIQNPSPSGQNVYSLTLQRFLSDSRLLAQNSLNYLSRDRDLAANKQL